MIKRFTQTLFLRNKSSSYFFSEASRTGNKVREAERDIIAQKIEEEAHEDETQNQFKSNPEDKLDQNRTTPGWILYRLLFWGSSAILAYNTYLVSQHDKKTPVESQKGAIPGFITGGKFLYQSYIDATQFLTQPPLSKLLPDIVHPLLQPKTLVLNLSGTLLNSEYIFGKGLIVHKRPGLQQFLQKMSQLYEIVIFSDDDAMFINSLSHSIDPRRNLITGYFGHECMVFSRGHYIKDLNYLNRDIRKILVVDKTKKSIQKHQQNVITLSEFKGDQNDRELIQLTNLLQNLAQPDVKDIRKALEQMGQNPIQKYQQIIKDKQERIKSSKAGRLFGIFEKKN